MPESNEFMRHLFRGATDTSHEDVGQTVTSLCAALFPAMASKLFTIEEREQIFDTWYTVVKERIDDEAGEMDSVFMEMKDSDKEEVSGFYRSMGLDSIPDGETVRVIGKRKLDKWVTSVRALLAIEPM